MGTDSNNNSDVKTQLAVGEERFKTFEGKISGLENTVGELKLDIKGVKEKQYDQVHSLEQVANSVDSLTQKMDEKVFSDEKGIIAVCSRTRSQFSERFTWLRGIFLAILLVVASTLIREHVQDKKQYKQMEEISKMYKSAVGLLEEVNKVTPKEIGK